jgi:hypothetical protein
MRFILATVQNFRSVEDSSEFMLDEPTTCLDGTIEAGKAARLTALYRSQPIIRNLEVGGMNVRCICT